MLRYQREVNFTEEKIQSLWDNRESLSHKQQDNEAMMWKRRWMDCGTNERRATNLKSKLKNWWENVVYQEKVHEMEDKNHPMNRKSGKEEAKLQELERQHKELARRAGNHQRKVQELEEAHEKLTQEDWKCKKLILHLEEETMFCA